MRAGALGGRRSIATAVAWAGVVTGCLLIGLWARKATFYFDEYYFLLRRRSWGLDSFVEPHNEHLSTLPVLAYKVLLAVFGATSYVPFLVLLLVVHGATCLLLYAVARSRIGPWGALAPTAVLLLLGPAWMDLVWAFQVGFLASVGAGFAMILGLDRGTRAGDRWACAALVTGLLCSSLSLGFLVLGGVLILLRTGWRPPAVRRLWVVVAPAALYGAWSLGWGTSRMTGETLASLPDYLVDAITAGVGSVTGLARVGADGQITVLGGATVGVVAVVLLALRVRRGAVPPLAWAAAAGVLVLWVAGSASGIAGFEEARQPAQSRYQYATGAFLLLIAVALAGEARTRAWVDRRVRTSVAVVTVAICAANGIQLQERATGWGEQAAYGKAAAGALELSRGIVAPAAFPVDFAVAIRSGQTHLLNVQAGPYFSALDAFGSTADSPAEIARRPEAVREATDLVLARAERIDPAFATAALPAGAPCVTRPAGQEVALRSGTLAIVTPPGQPAVLQARRFAATPKLVVIPVDPGRTFALVVRADAWAAPWRFTVAGAGVTVRVCE